MFAYESEAGGLRRLLEFLDHLVRLHDQEALFPKRCGACGEEFKTLTDYLCCTNPKGHGFEDCSLIMKRPYTMVYRHCNCGNTLVLVLTEQTFPLLEEFWSTLRDISEEFGVPLRTVIAEFSRQLDHYAAIQRP